MALLDLAKVPVNHRRRIKSHTKEEDHSRDFSYNEQLEIQQMFDKGLSYEKIAEYFDCDKLSVVRAQTQLWIAIKKSVCSFE